MTKDDRIMSYRSVLSTSHMSSNLINRCVEWLDGRGYFVAPASTKYHGAYAGGLFDHSYNVATTLLDLTRKLGLTWDSHSNPAFVGLMHDVCKCDQYAMAEDGTFTYRTDPILTGHGDKSVMLLSTLCVMTDEEVACIRYHMGAFSTDKEEWTRYTNAIHKYPNVLWMHTADIIGAHILEVGDEK